MFSSVPAADFDEREEYMIVPCCAGASRPDYRHSDKKLNLFTQNRTDNQRWELDHQGGDTYIIRSVLNRKYALDVRNFSVADTEMIFLNSCHGQSNQLFRMTPLRTPKRESEWGASRSDCSGTDWSVWDGSTDTKWYTQNSKASVFEISTAEQLAGAAKLVNSGTDFSGKQIILRRDINLCGYEWAPIGNAGRYFRGSFLGGRSADLGGMSLRSGNAEIENLVFENNYAEDNGGAVETAMLRIFRAAGCTFNGNAVDDDGGAVYYANTGSKDSVIEDAVFSENHSGKDGGGIYVGESHLVLINAELRKTMPAAVRIICLSSTTLSIRMRRS